MKPNFLPAHQFAKITGTPATPCSVLLLKDQQFIRAAKTDGSPSADYYQLIWVTKGNGSQWTDLQKKSICEDQIVCLRPGQVHLFEPEGELHGYVIRLHETFVRNLDREVNSIMLIDLLRQFSNSKGITLQQDLRDTFHVLIHQLQKTIVGGGALKDELMKCYTELLIIHLNRQWDGALEPQQKTRNIDLVESFLSLLERNYKEVRMVGEYASQLSVTPNYLNEIVKKTTGISAGQLIRHRVGLEANRKALHSGMCMKEVAYFLGFNDQAHFSKFFKNITGRNFSDVRKDRLTLAFPGFGSDK